MFKHLLIIEIFQIWKTKFNLDTSKSLSTSECLVYQINLLIKGV